MSGEYANIALSQLLCRPVTSRDGRVLGYVDDIILDGREGRIEYIRLALEPRAPAAEKSLAIPWSQFRLASNEADVELNISPGVLAMRAKTAE